MICRMLRVDIECQRKLAVALKTCTLFVALQRLLVVAFARLRGIALGFLLDPLTIASDDDLVLARLVFLARLREVTRSHIGMATRTEFLAASLLTRLFALASTVTLLLAFVDTTLQHASADLTTTDLAEPAGLVLDDVLATHTRLSCQVRTLGAILFVSVTSMANLRVAAAFRSLAGETTRGWPSTTRKRGLQNGTSTIAADLVEDGIPARAARSLVTEFLTTMLRVAAFQLATA